MSISVDPKAVNRMNRPDASARAVSRTCSSPNRRMSNHIGTRTTSKAMKKSRGVTCEERREGTGLDEEDAAEVRRA